MNPDDCRSCRQVFAALEEHQKHAADPETPLTAEAIGQAASLGKRAVRVHLAHLWAHNRIDGDRRTPLRGSTASEPVLPGALEWAAAVVAPDPTCAKCLIALAHIGWEGQVKTEDLARVAGISLRSVERHRPHLIRADLVAFRPVTVIDPVTGHVERKADRFTLLSQFTAAPLAGDEELAKLPERAARVVDQVHWFSGGPDERAIAESSVRWFLRNGWPEHALLRALDATRDRQAFNPGGYLSKLLKRLPPQYLLPARDVYTGKGSPRQAECPVCKAPFKTTIPGHPLCGTGVCLEAADMAARSIPPQGVPRELIPVRVIKSA
ncbi:hypothetical protein ACFWNL_18370 [Kitasatospora sp. NPDC058397]|uniref:hypothetical protein n=1 Tax=unclassified Kitasatospora TaxID=2633591 RepID=UPI0036494792